MSTEPNPNTDGSADQLEGNESARVVGRLIAALTTRRMTADGAAQASATVVVAHAVLAIAAEQRTANIIALAERIGTESALTAIIDVALHRMGLLERITELSLAANDLDAVEIPTAEDLEYAIEVMATDLWEADPGKQSPARTFGEDYGVTQDRYRTLARAVLAPEPVEPEAKR